MSSESKIHHALARVIHDDKTLNYQTEVKFTVVFESEEIILLTIDSYKPDDVRIAFSGDIPEILWNEYGVKYPGNKSTHWLELPYKGWNIFSAMEQRDGIYVTLVKFSQIINRVNLKEELIKDIELNVK